MDAAIAATATLYSDRITGQADAPSFDAVERNALTDEQTDACICMDDAVQVVAAAGSGKTSTMVAKTGYVLHEKLAGPEQILLLAFNNDAAAELRERIRTLERQLSEQQQ